MNKPPKTPPAQLLHSRNWHRRQRGIPEDAPPGTRREPFNRKRRGHGNVTKEVSMPGKGWITIDAVRGDKSRGELLYALLEDWVQKQMGYTKP